MSYWNKVINRSEIVYRICRILKGILVAIRSFKLLVFQAYPLGHYYSPIPNSKQILKSLCLNSVSTHDKCLGIDLKEMAQLDLLNKLSQYYGDLPFTVRPSNSQRFYYDNSWFGYADAIVLFCILRYFEPSKVIEVGSGFSSAVMLDTNDKFLDGSAQFTFIEPHPNRLNTVLNEQDKRKCTMINRPIQEIRTDVFKTLSTNDILFIDSSHVVKSGSDVAHIMFEILPNLNCGVIVHFHDILWPFEYPYEWFAAGRAWNEAYFIRAFLQYNKSFDIIYYNSFMNLFHEKHIRRMMPLCLQKSSYKLTEAASSLWLRKVQPTTLVAG